MNEKTATPGDFPKTARVVIIGGGIMGCGLAYHLAHEGWSDVVLLEKAELTSGSTWHAAGQITHSTSSFGLGKCVDYNISLYSGALERETGVSVSWHGCGSYRLAYDDDEMDWLRHTMSVGRALGVPIELVDNEHIARHHPFYNLDGVKGALYTPEDGHADPSGITQALAAGARAKGVRIIRRCRATDIRREPGGEWTVTSESGEIRCEHVVNAGGTYARQMGEWSGLLLPMTSMTHHYFVTDPVPEFADIDDLPVVRDDRLVSGYVRMEQKSGLIGIYEKANPNSVWEDGCPWETENELFAPDYDRVAPWLSNALERVPVLAERGIRREVHGAISHPPDGSPMIGPAPGAPNYWCCCGVQVGIGWGPGLSRELARWMVHGAADISMREFDPRRFGDWADKSWQVKKAHEDYLLRHEIPFPHFNRQAGRPVARHPLYDRLKQAGAVFEEVYGHERPRWFARDGIERCDQYSFRRNQVHDIVGAEVAGVRGAVGLMDITAFAKVEVAGSDAGAMLGRLVANRVPARDGGIALTHLLNARGRIEVEITLIRITRERYYLVCAAFFERRLIDHIASAGAPGEYDVINRSRDWGALSLQGPKSREVLSRTTDAGLDNASFGWLRARTIEVAGHETLALRMSYAGELGWELHGEARAMADIYDALMKAGAAHGIVNYGSFAMNVMRLEKGFKGAGELTNEVTLREADVMRFVDMDKGDFLGREATLASIRAAESGKMPWVCAYIGIETDGDTESDGHGGEAVLHKGRVVGSTSSMAYGHTVGQGLGFAYLQPSAARPGTELTVVVMNSERPAKVLGAPAYDPDNLLPRADAAG